ncbi:MAG: FAD-dependent oxidoreductase, partial [Desulfobacterales bacterium]|nr:FAD-dependent oxidoreductase [Desulfobacterales bacterium]
QAIPLVAYIDETCLFLKEEKCDICRGVCQADAIDFRQTQQSVDIKVGAVILSPGITPFNPGEKPEYGYGVMENVVTSMDFERLLSSTGPYEGKVLRASDKKHPKNIAWIQCVGSRRVTEGDNSYCSGVCCTYTQKQVILTKDHEPDTRCTVFHNDIRSHGKDFERYFRRADQLDGVEFIRSYPSIAGENPENKNVIIRYATNTDGVKEEEFDMVVLSVGLTPPDEYARLADQFGIDLNTHGFNKPDHTNPVVTNRKGIFVSGAFQGPTDIPESVFSASAAGSQCGELLDYRRGKLARERQYPEEQDRSGEEPKIGVFVCHCGANISSVVDIPSTVEYVKTLPDVVYAQEQLFSCATNSAKEITDLSAELGLNRVVIAACSPRTLEPLFRDTLREAGLNQYYMDMANIREHCSWVHSREKEAATKKAQDIIRMSVARARFLEPLREFDLPVNKTALVVGGGIAGMTCALSIAEQGHEVHIVEKAKDLGGMARRLHKTIEGMDVQALLDQTVKAVYANPKIHITHEADITDVAGFLGNFTTTVKSRGQVKTIKHGASVLAIGADVYKPSEYLYGESDKVFTHIDLGGEIAKGNEAVTGAQSLVMIQCVGCRNEDRDYCSRVCCSHGVKNALALKKVNPDMDIHILFRDMRTYGLKEDYYRDASDKGVKFIRYEPEEPPEVETAQAEDGRDVIRITVPDYILGQKLELDADILSLAAAVIPPESIHDIAGKFKVTLSPDDFFKEAHVKLKPVEFAADGVFLCGTAHYPKHIQETINQAKGAAGRVLTLLSKDTAIASGSFCRVIEEDCVSCGACITVCSYEAIEFVNTPKGKKAMVNPILCKGDGLCTTKCPTSAIGLKHFTDNALHSQIDAAIDAPAAIEAIDANGTDEETTEINAEKEQA